MIINNVCVIGLGYVGLPLAVRLAKHFSVIGFDVNQNRISELKESKDHSGEVSETELRESSIIFSDDPTSIKEAQMIIVCVPTPIDNHKKPDLKYVKLSSKTVGENLAQGSIIVYESTVFPGVTEDVCVPILEENSGLKCGVEFKVGYSPERMNPGDKERTIDKIVKVVAGMDEESLNAIDYVYSKITKTHRASSIKVAEGAKVIENIQRDLNIALMNELAIIFDKAGIDVNQVLQAAGTKWNFHNYKPGLVGGHCIGVDPYYLTYKAEELGYHPEIILAGRRINDNMHQHYASKVIKRLSKIETENKQLNVFIMGLTFKPNVSDYRNSRVKHLIQELQEYHIKVHAYDPFLNSSIIENEFGASYLHPSENLSSMDLALMTVEHNKLKELEKEGKFSGLEVLRLHGL